MNQTRFEEPRVIREVLRLLTTTNTLEEFYATSIPEADGRQRPMRDIAARARSELDRHQREFTTMMQSTIEEVRTDLLNPGGGTVTDTNLAQYIGRSCYNLFQNYQTDVPNLDQNARSRVFASTYAYQGYLTCRAISYARSNGNVDPNDCEDWYISMHVDILRPDTFVTDDGGTRQALNQALSLFPHIAAPGVKINSRIITTQQFREEVQQQATP